MAFGTPGEFPLSGLMGFGSCAGLHPPRYRGALRSRNQRTLLGRTPRPPRSRGIASSRLRSQEPQGVASPLHRAETSHRDAERRPRPRHASLCPLVLLRIDRVINTFDAAVLMRAHDRMVAPAFSEAVITTPIGSWPSLPVNDRLVRFIRLRCARVRLGLSLHCHRLTGRSRTSAERHVCHGDTVPTRRHLV